MIRSVFVRLLSFKTSEVLALFFQIIILYLQSTLNSKYCIKLKYFLVNSGGLGKRMPKMVPFAAPTNTQSSIYNILKENTFPAVQRSDSVGSNSKRKVSSISASETSDHDASEDAAPPGLDFVVNLKRK